ncbi:creatininase family protein [Rubinisphaera sp.]|uniref:creatininase family protein n=1 Tax=Rubinisphaera sp. TaxID=2024857 RepID=UPI000C10E792|nr:creatininase family protein [Rubinisphaera sp.]MBV11335.1 amidase [Rubinisphaera sp.]HCS50340.1 creatininase [Planctomycetaceae bacterium]|tara:strand:+ start:3334 stop:4098 length:765 start_codon:yes stop_codon:yes gene_type:complete
MKFAEMTSPELAEVKRDQTIVVIPIAAVEQHGPHLPTATDTIICTAIAEKLEGRMSEEILLVPTLWLGASAHHLLLGATVDCRLKNYIELLQDIARSFLQNGHQRVLFLNGHGGNIDPLKVALRQLQLEFPEALLAGGSYWSGVSDLLHETLDGDHKFVGHACEFETSMILHLRPELVRQDLIADAGELFPDEIDGFFISRDMMQRTRQGCTGRPDLATAEKGKVMMERIGNSLESTIKKLLRQKLGLLYEDFF